MSRPCTICSLDQNFNVIINDKIKKQVSDKLIVQFLFDQYKIETSITSVARHRKNCLGIKSNNNVMNVMPLSGENDELTGLDVETAINEAKAVLNTLDLAQRINDDIDLSLVMLSDITRNQLAILKISQDRYIAGNGMYPKDQFRDLNTILTLRERFGFYKRIEQGYIAKNTVESYDEKDNVSSALSEDIQLDNDQLELDLLIDKLNSHERGINFSLREKSDLENERIQLQNRITLLKSRIEARK
jgi:hypothetical protein